MADLGAPPRRFNIVWIMIDTMRADHTSLLGYSKFMKPYLEALGEEKNLMSDTREGRTVERLARLASATLTGNLAEVRLR
jgi:hypothetical protein